MFIEFNLAFGFNDSGCPEYLIILHHGFIISHLIYTPSDTSYWVAARVHL